MNFLLILITGIALGAPPLLQETPYCAFDNGVKMTMDRNDKLSLPFTVFWADTHPTFVIGQWSCNLLSPGRNVTTCP